MRVTTWICDADRIYTDAALMLDASSRVVAAEGSGLIDLHAPRVVDHGRWHNNACSCLVLREGCLCEPYVDL